MFPFPFCIDGNFFLFPQAVSTKAAIDEIEGKVDYKTKLLVLKEEERKIKEEKAEYLEEKNRIEQVSYAGDLGSNPGGEIIYWALFPLLFFFFC